MSISFVSSDVPTICICYHKNCMHRSKMTKVTEVLTVHITSLLQLLTIKLSDWNSKSAQDIDNAGSAKALYKDCQKAVILIYRSSSSKMLKQRKIHCFKSFWIVKFLKKRHVIVFSLDLDRKLVIHLQWKGHITWNM
jgi:hypothetical protein